MCAEEINAALQSIKVIFDWLNANKSLGNCNELVAAISDVKSRLIDAKKSSLDFQASNKSLTEQIGELKKELAYNEKFDEEILRYVLHKLESGMLVYMIKPVHQEIGEPHYICTECVSNRKISLFQPALNGTRLVCDSCQKNVTTGWKPGSHKTP